MASKVKHRTIGVLSGTTNSQDHARCHQLLSSRKDRRLSKQPRSQGPGPRIPSPYRDCFGTREAHPLSKTPKVSQTRQAAAKSGRQESSISKLLSFARAKTQPRRNEAHGYTPSNSLNAAKPCSPRLPSGGIYWQNGAQEKILPKNICPRGSGWGSRGNCPSLISLGDSPRKELSRLAAHWNGPRVGSTICRRPCSRFECSSPPRIAVVPDLSSAIDAS